MTNPVLVEVMRGHLVESAHCGSIVVARASGERVLALGDVGRVVYPRSAIKAFQTLPLVETGAADAFGYGPAEIALACASHSGTERHVRTAAQMLQRAGLGEASLGCGAHEPMGATAARELLKSGREPTQLHNNCSGKHAGMCATAVHLGEPVENYLSVTHPVQQRVAAALRGFLGDAFDPARFGIDGCSAPNWAVPLSSLAHAFAQLVTGEGAARGRRAVVDRVLAACWSEPELVAGPGRLDTQMMQQFPGRVFLKTGAEGVYCGALPDFGLGFALKIDDGAKRAAEVAVAALIAQLIPAAEPFALPLPVINWRGSQTGVIRIGATLARSLNGLKV